MKRGPRVLGIETSGTVCGVAHVVFDRPPAGLADALSGGAAVLREHVSPFSRHSESIYALLDSVFRAVGSRLDRVDAIAVSIGPGSFTGLRVGLAAVKVFAKFGRIPLVGVPTLEAQVAQAAIRGGNGRYVATVDAKRGEVYAAVFEYASDRLRKVAGPRVCDPVALARDLTPGSKLVTAPPRATAIAGLGALLLLRGNTENVDRVVPLYVRRPAAVEKLRGRERVKPARR